MARITLSAHWKFQRLARALGSRVLARGVLETLWEPCWSIGEAYVGTSDDIEALCEWKGERGALTQALLTAGSAKSGAGFIEPYDSVRDASEPHYQIHDFFQHCPEYVRRRRNAENGAYPRTCRVCGEEFYALHPRGQFCKDACRQAAHRGAVTHDVTQLSRSHGKPRLAKPSLAKPTGTYVNSSPPKTAGEPVADVPGLEVDGLDVDGLELDRTDDAERHEPPPTTPILATSVLTFPVVGKDGPSWHLREDQVKQWRALYPNLDVLGEARQALAWIDADLSRRKTARGMTKFLVAWFNRSVDSMPRTRGPTVVTGSLKTAGNKAAIEAFLKGRGYVE